MGSKKPISGRVKEVFITSGLFSAGYHPDHSRRERWKLKAIIGKLLPVFACLCFSSIQGVPKNVYKFGKVKLVSDVK